MASTSYQCGGQWKHGSFKARSTPSSSGMTRARHGIVMGANRRHQHASRCVSHPRPSKSTIVVQASTGRKRCEIADGVAGYRPTCISRQRRRHRHEMSVRTDALSLPVSFFDASFNFATTAVMPFYLLMVVAPRCVIVTHAFFFHGNLMVLISHCTCLFHSSVNSPFIS